MMVLHSRGSGERALNRNVVLRTRNSFGVFPQESHSDENVHRHLEGNVGFLDVDLPLHRVLRDQHSRKVRSEIERRLTTARRNL